MKKLSFSLFLISACIFIQPLKAMFEGFHESKHKGRTWRLKCEGEGLMARGYEESPEKISLITIETPVEKTEAGTTAVQFDNLQKLVNTQIKKIQDTPGPEREIAFVWKTAPFGDCTSTFEAIGKTNELPKSPGKITAMMFENQAADEKETEALIKIPKLETLGLHNSSLCLGDGDYTSSSLKALYITCNSETIIENNSIVRLIPMLKSLSCLSSLTALHIDFRGCLGVVTKHWSSLPQNLQRLSFCDSSICSVVDVLKPFLLEPFESKSIDTPVSGKFPKLRQLHIKGNDTEAPLCCSYEKDEGGNPSLIFEGFKEISDPSVLDEMSAKAVFVKGMAAFGCPQCTFKNGSITIKDFLAEMRHFRVKITRSGSSTEIKLEGLLTFSP